MLPCLVNMKKQVPSSIEMCRRRLEEFPDEVIDVGEMLREADLSFNLINFIPPDSFEALFNLTDLNLQDNMLQEIPESVGFLTALTCMNLGRNRLAELPDTARKLLNLIELDLHDNMFQVCVIVCMCVCVCVCLCVCVCVCVYL